MEELEVLLEVIGVGVLDDDISVMQRGLEEELVGHGEGEVSAIEAEEDGGDKGVAEEGGLEKEPRKAPTLQGGRNNMHGWSLYCNVEKLKLFVC